MAQVCGVVRNGNRRREGRDIGVGSTKMGGVAYTRESDRATWWVSPSVGMWGGLGTIRRTRSTFVQLQRRHQDDRESLYAHRSDENSTLYRRRSIVLCVTHISHCRIVEVCLSVPDGQYAQVLVARRSRILADGTKKSFRLIPGCFSMTSLHTASAPRGLGHWHCAVHLRETLSHDRWRVQCSVWNSPFRNGRDVGHPEGSI
jgi:hypothetical protein